MDELDILVRSVLAETAKPENNVHRRVKRVLTGWANEQMHRCNDVIEALEQENVRLKTRQGRKG